MIWIVIDVVPRGLRKGLITIIIIHIGNLRPACLDKKSDKQVGFCITPCYFYRIECPDSRSRQPMACLSFRYIYTFNMSKKSNQQ